MSDEVDFLHEDSYESFLQIDSMILMGMIKYSQSSQNSMFTLFLQYLRKEFRGGVDFLHSDKHKVSHKLISTLGIKVSYKMIQS